MAEQKKEIPFSVFLPGIMMLSQEDIDYQIAHGGDFNCAGLNTFTITLMVIVTFAVVFRLWSRKIAKIEWQSDDLTLVVGWVRAQFLQCLVSVPTRGAFVNALSTDSIL